jgi:hypothetical protein
VRARNRPAGGDGLAGGVRRLKEGLRTGYVGGGHLLEAVPLESSGMVSILADHLGMLHRLQRPTRSTAAAAIPIFWGCPAGCTRRT